jgi:hypothetical protein
MNVFDTSTASVRAAGRSVAARARARPAGSGARSRSRVGTAALSLRALGALALLSVGAVHLQQYLHLYHAIPTIGTLFALNFAGATAMGLGLLAPVERLLGRLGAPAVALLALGGVGLAATSFVFLLVSEHTPLFGFMEPDYDPPAILASRVAEAVTVLSLGGFLAARLLRRRRVAG